MILVQNIIWTLFGVSFALVIRNKPKFPPSAEAEDDIDNESFISVLQKLLKNRPFVMLAMIFAIALGQFNGIGAVGSPLYEFYNDEGKEPTYSTNFIIITALASVATGTAVSFLAAFVFKNWKKFSVRLVFANFVFIVIGTNFVY